MTTGQLQLTLAILKPDITKVPLFVQAVRAQLARAGFRVVRSRQLWLTRSRAEVFYSEHSGRFFHTRLVTFMSSGPIWVHVLARRDAIAAWRQLMGPTRVFRAVYESPDCLRARYGLTDTRNALHGSDSPESATREISFFFPEFDAADWLQQQEVSLRACRDFVSSYQAQAASHDALVTSRGALATSRDALVASQDVREPGEITDGRTQTWL